MCVGGGGKEERNPGNKSKKFVTTREMGERGRNRKILCVNSKKSKKSKDSDDLEGGGKRGQKGDM